VMVGALLCKPVDAAAAAGVIFFNNVGFLGMCGHGTIGLAATLAHMGRIAPGEHAIETPVGTVRVILHERGEVTVENVASYRSARAVEVEVEGEGRVVGDVAWGGNWFFLVQAHKERIALDNVDRLTDYAWRIRRALERNGITGQGGQQIDHIELFGAPSRADAHSKNFVLCPGKAYDRSPCGTGTSAKLACLAAEGKLREGEVWRQESIVGSLFEASYQSSEGGLLPSIIGAAYVNAEAVLLLDPRDPFEMGIRR
jgi:4-hydroxyproline epimerase